jgi:hypothetical protein
MKKVRSRKEICHLKSNKLQKYIGNPVMTEEEGDIKDIEYLEMSLFRALKVPHVKYNPMNVQEDYYLGCR